MPAWRPPGISRGLSELASRLRRPAALAAVALLHVALVLVLLVYSNERNARVRSAAPEIMLHFQPLPTQNEPAPLRRAGGGAVHSPGPALPDYRGIVVPGANVPASPALRQSLFGCSDDERADLSPSARANCANAFARDDSVDIRDGTNRSRSAALWERRRERRNAPLLLPCMNTQAPGVSLYTIYCLAKGAVVGFNPDDQESYADQPVIVHVPNGGDPPSSPPSSH